MKQIVRVITSGLLTVENEHHAEEYHNHKIINQLRYVEFSPKTIETIDSYDELIDRKIFSSYSSGRFTKIKYGDRYSEMYYDFCNSIKFSAQNFVSYTIIKEYFEQHNYTLQELMDNLPSEEMIEYLKDNGLNICPIARW